MMMIIAAFVSRAASTVSYLGKKEPVYQPGICCGTSPSWGPHQYGWRWPVSGQCQNGTVLVGLEVRKHPFERLSDPGTTALGSSKLRELL